MFVERLWWLWPELCLAKGAPWVFRLIEGVDFSPLRGMSVSYEGSLMTTKTMVIAVGCTCKCLFITRMTHVTYIWLGFRMAIRLLFLVVDRRNLVVDSLVEARTGGR